MLAPFLFNLFFDAVIAMVMEAHPGERVTVFYHPEAELVGSRKKMSQKRLVQDLKYADDLCLMAVSRVSLEGMLHSLHETSTEVGLSISTKKTKILAVPPQPPHQHPLSLSLDGEAVSVVEEFEYLGSTVTSTCSLDKEIDCQINKASRSVTSLSKILWYQRKIKWKNKLCIFKAVVLPTLLYGSETWAVLGPHLHRLQSFVMHCLRIILGVSMHEKMRNTEIRELANMETVESMIRRRGLRWLGHMARMPQSQMPRQLMVCRPEGGKYAAGGQKLRWNAVVARDVKKCEMLSEWRSVAKDQREWRGKVAAAVEDLNEEAEKQEKQRKDEQKRRRQEAAATGDMWPCGLSAWLRLCCQDQSWPCKPPETCSSGDISLSFLWGTVPMTRVAES